MDKLLTYLLRMLLLTFFLMFYLPGVVIVFLVERLNKEDT